MPGDTPEARIAENIESNRIYKLKKTGVSADDIVHIWNYVSTYINTQMQKDKGVNINGLGQFTFTQKKTDVGNNKFLLVQRPVFVLSERFAQQHQISSQKYHLTGQVTVSDLNYTAVAFETPYNRDLVEEAVRDVILEFSRALNGGRNIEFSFSTVGRLSIRNRKVKMRFYKEFVNCLEGGDDIMKLLQDRPETADSVMSRCSVRPQSRNTMVLPGIGESSGRASKRPLMQPIDEEQTAINDTEPVNLDQVGIMEGEMAERVRQLEQSGEMYMGDASRPEDSAPEGFYACDAQELNAMGLPGMLLEERPQPEVLNAKESLMNMRSNSRMLAPIAKAGAFSFDDMRPPTANQLTGRQSAGSAPSIGRRSATMDPLLSTPKPLSPLVQSNRPASRLMETHRPATQSQGQAWPAEPRNPTPSMNDCGHSNAGQELCYLCHQRAARNIPVSFEDERKKREEEEDQVLHDYQIMKNNESILKEQEKNQARRYALQKQAAFNLGVAEAIIDKKIAKPVKEHPKAYIFQKRPLTPPRYVKQQQLQGYLSSQIEHRTNATQKERADQEFLERLEQVQLAEDLAAQREQFLKDRYGEREKYKDALATQLKYKPLQVPDRLPDGEVFGKNDTTQADIQARRHHARRIADEQLNTVADRKRSEILKRLQEQKDEEAKLRKNKEDLLDDRSQRYERMVRNRKTLEGDWVKASEAKKGREIEERLRCLTPGALVHEQCDDYKRCGQCQKRMNNCGETNLWKESYYIPGARIMV